MAKRYSGKEMDTLDVIDSMPWSVTIYDAQGNKVVAHAGRLDKKMLAAYLDPLT